MIHIVQHSSPSRIFLKQKTKSRRHTDKKENKIFLIYKEIHMASGAKSYIYEEGLPNI